MIQFFRDIAADVVDFAADQFLGVFVGAVLMLIPMMIADTYLRGRAVDNGAAVWRVDNRGNTTFHWKDEK